MKVIITLELDDEDDAAEVAGAVDSLLDEGRIQELIQEWLEDLDYSAVEFTNVSCHIEKGDK